ncbi:hypothetical protein HPB48_002304 [Haemaphysalis longicornis]|uniref:Uncharacterized protein n=1 Tax=Haemaphysalis longicornis TaxID=44386 RepID=A0A9J6GUD5_HAELO|nr:hypothetical protein HPB48_002304 [Haemaphysalis longicornis]
MQLVKRYIRIKEGISVFKTHLDFNRTCKERKVVPESLRLKRPVSTPEGLNIITKAEHRLVNARLHECNAAIRKKELDLFFAKRQLEHRIPGLMASVDEFADSVAASTADKHRITQDKKLSCLSIRPSPQIAQDQGFVTNLSSRTLTQEQTSVLAKGHSYMWLRAPPPPPPPLQRSLPR